MNTSKPFAIISATVGDDTPALNLQRLSRRAKEHGGFTVMGFWQGRAEVSCLLYGHDEAEFEALAKACGQEAWLFTDSAGHVWLCPVGGTPGDIGRWAHAGPASQHNTLPDNCTIVNGEVWVVR